MTFAFAVNSKPKTQNSKLPLFLSLLLLLLTACAKPSVPVGPVPEAKELLGALTRQAEAFDSLRGMARVRVATPENSFTANQVLLVRKPDLLRAETLSPFGSPVLTVAADGRRLSALVPGEGRFFTGAASYRNLQRFTRLPLQLTDLVQLLLYQVPQIPWEQSRVEAAPGGWRLVLEAADGAVRQELAFDGQLRLTGADYLQADLPVLRLAYGPFDRQSGFPQAMRVETPAQQSEASLIFSEVEVNVPIPEERFRLSPPAGYTVEDLP